MKRPKPFWISVIIHGLILLILGAVLLIRSCGGVNFRLPYMQGGIR